MSDSIMYHVSKAIKELKRGNAEGAYPHVWMIGFMYMLRILEEESNGA